MTNTPSLTTRVLLVFTSVWFIAAAALGTRLAFTWDQQQKIPHQALATVPFDQEAGNIAFALSQGHGFSNLFRQNTGPTAWLAPVYPLLLSFIFRIFGGFTLSSFFAGAILNALLSAAVIFPLFAIAGRASSRTVAIVSSWLWVFLPAGILMPFEWIWDTSLSVLLATLLVWLTLKIAESPELSVWLSYGALWAFVLLTNPSLGIALPFLLAWAAMRANQQLELPWRIPALTVAVIVACCLPWTVRNYNAFHKLIPIRSNFAFELWIGNNDIFDEHAVGGIQRITRYEETRKYAQLGETAYLAEKSAAAKTFISNKPALFFQLTGRRIMATSFGTNHPLADFRRTDSWLVRVILLGNLLLAVGTLLGIWFLLRTRNPLAFPIAALPVLYPLVYYLTHTSLRYRHPIDPLLVLLTTMAIAACCSRKYRAARSKTDLTLPFSPAAQ
jgi:hypothetical protein